MFNARSKILKKADVRMNVLIVLGEADWPRGRVREVPFATRDEQCGS